MIGTPRIERAARQPIPGAIKVATWRPSGWSKRTDSGLCDGWGSLWSKATRRLTEETRPLGAVVVRWLAEFCDQRRAGNTAGQIRRPLPPPDSPPPFRVRNPLRWSLGRHLVPSTPNEFASARR